MSRRSPESAVPLACVVGDISMVRALGIRKIPVAVATPDPRAKSTHSRYCREVVVTPDWAEDPGGAVAALLEWGRQQPCRPVLFYQGDYDLVAISRARDELAPYFHIVLPDAELVEDLADKLRFHRLARRRGLTVPETLVVSEGASVKEVLDQWDRYPCVFKAAMRGGWYLELSGQRKALRIDTPEALEGVLTRIDLTESRFLIQAPIEGGEENVLSYHAYVRPGGEVVGEFTGRKIRTAPREYGRSTYLEITDDKTIRELGRDTIDRLDFSGVLKIDFKQDSRDGRIYIMEINPRFNLWHHPATVAGVALPEAVYRDCTGSPVAAPLCAARKGVRWIVPLSDARALGEHRSAGELSRVRWLMQMLTAEVNEGFNLRDPYPALVDLFRLLRQKILPGRRGAGSAS